MKKLDYIADKRANTLKDYPLIESELSEIRSNAINNLSNNIDKAIKSLEAKGARVYFVKTETEAHDIIKEILKNEEQVVRTFSNTLREIDFDAQIGSNDGLTVHKSNIYELLLDQVQKETEGHPIFPYLGGTRECVFQALQSYLNTSETDVNKVNKAVHKKIKEHIVASKFGVTGISSIVAENGTAILAEEEGDGRAVSNLPYNHIVVAGIEKITNTVEEATTTIQGTAIYGHGKKAPNYISYISGPSRTADIEFRMAYGMHGPKEVHIILLDNGRTDLIEKGHKEILKCIDCGACFNSMKKVAEENKWESISLTPKAIALGIIQGKLAKPAEDSLFPDFECPVGITAESIKKL